MHWLVSNLTARIPTADQPINSRGISHCPPCLKPYRTHLNCQSISQSNSRLKHHTTAAHPTCRSNLLSPPPGPRVFLAVKARQSPINQTNQIAHLVNKTANHPASSLTILTLKKVSERNFHRFMVRSGVESSLGGDGACGLIERMDPRATGYILYNKFLDKVRDEQQEVDALQRLILPLSKLLPCVGAAVLYFFVCLCVCMQCFGRQYYSPTYLHQVRRRNKRVVRGVRHCFGVVIACTPTLPDGHNG